MTHIFYNCDTNKYFLIWPDGTVFIILEKEDGTLKDIKKIEADSAEARRYYYHAAVQMFLEKEEAGEVAPELSEKIMAILRDG
jgi:predicted Fe-Mo cluster-binding NifX family protein